MNFPKFRDCIFVKIIHKKRYFRKWHSRNGDWLVLMPCCRPRFEIDIESKWVYSHIKLSSNFSYVLFQVITQFDACKPTMIQYQSQHKCG